MCPESTIQQNQISTTKFPSFGDVAKFKEF